MLTVTSNRGARKALAQGSLIPLAPGPVQKDNHEYDNIKVRHDMIYKICISCATFCHPNVVNPFLVNDHIMQQHF